MARLVFSRWAALVAAEIRGIVTPYRRMSANDEFIECVTKKFAYFMRILRREAVKPLENPSNSLDTSHRAGRGRQKLAQRYPRRVAAERSAATSAGMG